MKRMIMCILAPLLAAFSLVSCGSSSPEKSASSETEAAEHIVNLDLVTENGEARAHVVVAEGADPLLVYGAEELVTHAKKVSGATLSVVTAPRKDGLSIVIATPHTHPELTTLFPEDIAWLSTLEEDGKRYGADGFAIRRLDDTLYIFGMTERGALNGVYDFIEENMGVLWVRMDDATGTVYNETPTITVAKADYREKSPFAVRAWQFASFSIAETTNEIGVYASRNKLNYRFYRAHPEVGVSNFHLTHNLKQWLTSSPSYDPAITEYWNTDAEGNRLNAETSPQVNIWSDFTAETIADGILAYLAEHDVDNVGIGIEDSDQFVALPESASPFAYAPDRSVSPEEKKYLSTVFFTFLNKVAVKVKAVYPDVRINSYAYLTVSEAPLGDLEDNITIVVAPITEDFIAPINDTTNATNSVYYRQLEDWKKLTNNIVMYNYYGVSHALDHYERPIWDRIQTDLRYYAESGFLGLTPEGQPDLVTTYILKDSALCSDLWAMNSLTYWLYAKLSWNPEENIDELIVTFCDRMYGNASAHMQEYYRLIRQGWNEGYSVNQVWNLCYIDTEDLYLNTFVYEVNLEYEILAALQAAYETAGTAEKERILYIKESYEAFVAEMEEG